MARRGAGETRVATTRASARARGPVPTDPVPGTTRRMDALVELVDHCTAAKEGADTLGDKFLAYLLAMAIQEARAAMRASVESANVVVSANAPLNRTH